MELKGAVKMTVDYSDGSQTVVNYNPITSEQETGTNAPAPEVVEAVETPVEVVTEVTTEADVEVVSDETEEA